MGAAGTKICGLMSRKKGMNSTKGPVSSIHDETRWVAEEIFENGGTEDSEAKCNPPKTSRGRTRQAASVTFHRGNEGRKSISHLQGDSRRWYGYEQLIPFPKPNPQGLEGTGGDWHTMSRTARYPQNMTIAGVRLQMLADE